MKKQKKSDYHIFPLGDGKYKAIWQEGTTLYELVFSDKYESGKLKAMKNPYKNNVFPFIRLEFEEPAKKPKNKSKST